MTQCTGLANCGELRIEVRDLFIGRRLAVGTPDTLDRTGVGIEDGDAVIAVAVGDVDLVGLRIEFESGGLAELAQIRAAGERPPLAQLLDEFPVDGEFQDHAVVLAAAGEPDKSFVVDHDPVLDEGPVIAPIISGPAPGLDQVAGGVEHQH